jgi:hypothetical protein
MKAKEGFEGFRMQMGKGLGGEEIGLRGWENLG